MPLWYVEVDVKTPTDIQLKPALANELPDLLAPKPQSIAETLAASILVNLDRGIIKDDSGVLKQLAENTLPSEREFIWLATGKEVTDREWDWVVGQLEAKLPIGVQWDLLANRYSSYVIWQQRAIAYFKTIGKEVV